MFGARLLSCTCVLSETLSLLYFDIKEYDILLLLVRLGKRMSPVSELGTNVAEAN